MLAQRATVTYRDGTTAETVLTQWSMSQWALHCQMKGWSSDPQTMGLLVLTMNRYQAWAELHRDTKSRPAFDAWDATVLDVEAEAAELADPTQTVTSGD